MSTKYPNNIDNDSSLPRVDDNVSEVSSDTLNNMREAIVAIQEAIGINPQGSTANLVSRISEAINDDGTLKSSALVAAGLIALPITNSMIASSAGIEESKLDLDFATQTLQDQITSNDVDIAALQNSVANLINKFNRHVSGLGFRHTTAHIDLATALTGVVSSNLDGALVEINDRFLDHTSASAVGAHAAANISVDTSSLSVVASASNDVQSAIEDLDQSRNTLLRIHRDEMHANGFNNWSNNIDGYSVYNRKFPESTVSVSGSPIAGTRNAFEFDGYSLAGSFSIKQGDVLVVFSGAIAGQYVIDDVGPRAAIGTKPALSSDQFEIVGTFLDGYTSSNFQAAIYAQSSQNNFKTNVAPTIHQSDIRVDSLQVARPNSAKAISLGVAPNLIDSTHTLSIEAGVGSGNFRQITINNLNFNRLGSPAPTVTVDTIVERINDVVQNRTDGYAFPVAAYKVGDELMLSHNWVGNNEIYLKILPSGTGNFVLGFDGYGADIVNTNLYPTQSNEFYVGGRSFTDLATIINSTADVSGQVFTFSGLNPLSKGVKRGHLLHLKTHTNTSEVGTYFITEVTSSTVTISKNAGITAENDVQVEIYHDVLPLDDFSSNLDNQIVEAYLTPSGSIGYNERLSYSDNIANISIVDISDTYLSEEVDLVTTSVGSSTIFTLGTGVPVALPNSFVGQFKLYNSSNIEYIVIDVQGTPGIGTNSIIIRPHVDEEEFLEVCSLRLDGALTASNIRDKRLFGTTGIDEIREDYTQAYVERPLDDLRSDGVVRGLDILRDPDGSILSDGYFDPALYPNNQGLVFRGGTVYVGGARCDLPTTSLPFSNTAGTFTVVLNSIGTYQIISDSDFTLKEIIDGYAGTVTPIASVVHNGSDITSAEDRRFFINHLDDKVDFIVDLSNHMVGSFATVEAALGWISAYPSDEKFKLKIVSNVKSDIEISSVGRDITVEIDGSVGDLTVSNELCKIYSSSISKRDSNHIDGYLIVQNTCTDLEVENISLSNVSVNLNSSQKIDFNNCYFDGYGSGDHIIREVSGTQLSSMSFNDCYFGPLFGQINITSSSGSVGFNNCTVENGGSAKEFDIFVPNIVVENSTLNNTYFNTASVESVSVSSSRFKNTSTSSANSVFIVDGGLVSIANSEFRNIVTSGSGENAVDLEAASHAIIENCKFVSNVVSSSDYLIAMSGMISNSIFDGNTWPSNQSLRCDSFVGNKLQNSTTSTCLVGVVEATGNTGFTSFNEKSSSDTPRLISGNSFVNSGQGYNVDLSALDGYDQCVVTDNVFDSAGATTISSITLSSSSNPVIISNNVFRGSAPDTAISLASSNNVSVVNNYFSTAAALSSSSQGSNLNIGSNIFEESSFTIQLNSSCSITNNNFIDSSITLSGSTGISDSTVSNNTFDSSSTCTISPTTLNSCKISNNEFGTLNLNIASSVNDSVFSFNLGAITTPSSFSATNFIFSNNNIDYSSIGNITWDNSFISNNIFTQSANTTFTLASSGLGIDANVLIQENIFSIAGANAITISSTNPINSFAFSENINNSGSSSTVVFASQVNEAIIDGNFDFNLNVSSGSNACIFNGNMMPNSTLTLAGTCNSTIVGNNFIQDLDLECNSTGGLLVQNNFISNDLDVLSGVSGTLDITDGFIVNNYAVGDINVISDITDGSSNLTLTGTAFSTNLCSNVRVMSVADGTGVTSEYSFEQNVFTLNNVKVNCEVFSSSTNFADALNFSFEQNVFSGNTIDGYMSMEMADSSGTLVDIASTTVSSNNIGGQLLIDGDINFNGFFASNNDIASGVLWTIPGTQGTTNPVNSQIEFVSNKMSGDFNYNMNFSVTRDAHTLNDFVFTGNTMPDNELIFTINDNIASSSTPPFALNRCNISSNTLQRFLIDYDCQSVTSTIESLLDTGLLSNNFFTQSGASGGARFEINMSAVTTSGSATLALQNWGISGNLGVGSILSGGTSEFSFQNLSGSATPSLTVIRESIITNNSPFSWSGNDDVTFEDCVFSNNEARELDTLDFSNSLVSGNLVEKSSTLAIDSCQLVGNQFRGPAETLSITELTSSVITANTIEQTLDTSSAPSISNTQISFNYIINFDITTSGIIKQLQFVGNQRSANSTSDLTIQGSGLLDCIIANNYINIAGDLISTSTFSISSTSNDIKGLFVSNNFINRENKFTAVIGNLPILEIDSADELSDCQISNNYVGVVNISLPNSVSGFVSNLLISNNRTTNVTIDLDGIISFNNFIFVGNICSALEFQNTASATLSKFVVSNNIMSRIDLPATAQTLTDWVIDSNYFGGDTTFGSSSTTINRMRMTGNTGSGSSSVQIFENQFQSGVNRSVFVGNHFATWNSDDFDLDNQDALLTIGNTSVNDPGAGNRIICNTATGALTVENTNEFTGTNTTGGDIGIT